MQNILLPSNHIMMTSASDVATVCESFFKLSNITYCVYGRIYDDGTCFFLTNNEKFIFDYFKKGYRITAPAPSSIVAKKFHYFVSKNGAHSQAMSDAINIFNVDNIINFVDRYDGYFDLFCLGSYKDNDEIINFYLNKIDLIEHFLITLRINYLIIFVLLNAIKL